MANVYTVQYQGKQYEIQGDQAPTEQDMQSLVGQQTAAAPAAPQPQQAPSLGGFLHNVLTSGENVAKGIGQAIEHPATTLKTVAEIPVGLGEVAGSKIAQAVTGKPLPAQVTNAPAMQPQKVVQALGSLYANRYGSPQKAAKTIYSDPVGFLADVASVGDAAGAVGDLGKVGEVADKLDPLQAAMNTGDKAINATGKVPVTVATAISGKVAGLGADALRNIIANPDQDTIDALRGTVTQKDILESAEQAVQNIKNNRTALYAPEGSPMAAAKASGVPIDLEAARETINPTLTSHFADGEVNIDPKTGKIDFTNSSISNTSDQQAVQKAVDTLSGWKNGSVDGSDILKRNLGNIADDASSNEAKSVIYQLRDSVKSQLDQVPGYKDATQGYADASNLLSDIKSGLGVGGKNENAAVTKLFQTIKNNQGLRQELLSELDKQGAGNITGKISGALANPLLPSGLAGQGVATGALFQSVLTNAIHNPGALAGIVGELTASSPRLAGETALKIGQAAKALAPATNVIGGALGTATASPALNRLLEISSKATGKKASR